MGLGIHPLIKVFSVGEEVGDGVGMPWDVIKHKIEVLQEFHPSGLSAHNFLGLTEVLEVFMVCSDTDGVIGAKEVGAATFEPIDDGCYFFIVDIVVLFCQ
jgi:hypothetical protein